MTKKIRFFVFLFLILNLFICNFNTFAIKRNRDWDIFDLNVDEFENEKKILKRDDEFSEIVYVQENTVEESFITIELNSSGTLSSEDVNDAIKKNGDFFQGNIIIPCGYMYIEEKAFAERDDIFKVLIDDTVLGIGEGAFCDCRCLKEVLLPKNLTVISADLFNGCSNLECVTIPNEVTLIEHHAFYCCVSLNNIFIPKSVRVISNSAFFSCISLSEVIFEGIPEQISLLAFFDTIFAKKII